MNQLEEIIEKSINEIIEKFIQYPNFYINEEDIRCELYHKISIRYKNQLYFKNPYGDIYLSNAIHPTHLFFIHKLSSSDNV